MNSTEEEYLKTGPQDVEVNRTNSHEIIRLQLHNYVNFKFDEENIYYYEKKIGFVMTAKLHKDWTEIGESVPMPTKDTQVVVKACFLEGDDLTRFHEAYLKLKSCNNRNIVTVFFSGVYKPASYEISMNAFVMEAGEQSLANLLENQKDYPTDQQGEAAGRLTMAHCMSWMKQVASALAYLHDQKLIHRDVKPRNIILFNNATICKLCDFDDCTSLRSCGMTPQIGTGSFMAPEVARTKAKHENTRKYTKECDCYSFGMTVTAMLLRSPDLDSPVEKSEHDNENSPVDTHVAVFTSETESVSFDLKSSVFKYDVHKGKFSAIKKILDKALQADASARESSALILALLEQPESGAPDQPPELPPSNKSASTDSVPKVPSVRSVSRSSRTIFYEATLPDNEKFNSNQANHVLHELLNRSSTFSKEVDKEKPPEIEHKFSKITNGSLKGCQCLLIEHNIGGQRNDDKDAVEKHCRSQDHLTWLERNFESDVLVKGIKFAVRQPGKENE